MCYDDKKGGIQGVKTLLLVGGPMGVGKSTACAALQKMLPRNVWLDGDWCWKLEPLVVNAQTKALAMDNITYLLNGFLRCSEIDHVLFSWVMDEREILDALLSRLTLDGVRAVSVSLVCAPEVLAQRLERDAARGVRSADAVERGLARLPKYAALDTTLLDTTAMTAEETAARLAALVRRH